MVINVCVCVRARARVCYFRTPAVLLVSGRPLFKSLYSKPVVLNLGSIEPQGFVERVSLRGSAEVKNSKTIFNNTIFLKFMFCWFCSLILCATDAWFILCTNKIYTYVLKKSYFIFPITKGSVNALMKLVQYLQ